VLLDLDNGQVWRQVDTDVTVTVKPATPSASRRIARVLLAYQQQPQLARQATAMSGWPAGHSPPGVAFTIESNQTSRRGSKLSGPPMKIV
jgi:hypothetical protein